MNQKSIDWCKFLFYLSMIILISITLFHGLVTDGHPFQTIMFYGQEITFSDFYQSMADSVSCRPYERGAIYPALCYLFYVFFAKMIPSDEMAIAVETSIWDAVSHRQMGQMVFLYYNLLAVGILAIVIYNIKKGNKAEKLLFLFLLLLAEPVMYTLERGNLMLLTISFVMLFLVWKDSPIAWKKEMSFISLAIAASLKIYPAVFGILLLREKRWKDALKTIVWGLVFFIVPFLFMGGLKEIPTMIQNIFSTQDMFLSMTGYGYKVNIATVMGFLSDHWVPLFGKKIVIRAVQILFVIMMAIGVFVIDKEWKRWAMIALPIILLPSFSYVYNVIFLLPMLVAFLDNKERNCLDYVYLSMFIMCFAPIIITCDSYFVSHGEPWGYTFRTFIYGGALCLMGGVLSIEVLFNLIKGNIRKERV